MSVAQHAGRTRARRKGRGARLVLPFVVLAALGIAGAAAVAYLLWPRWPAAHVTLDAPSLPVNVGGVAFNIPPAAIRIAVQRRSGTHDRLDLAFLWPSLTPPDPHADAPRATSDTPIESLKPAERLFVTIAGSAGALAPDERRKTIYPRYVAGERMSGPGGLTVAAFRDGSPYQGEDLVYAAAEADRFAVRCTRPGPATVPGTCLDERRIGDADIVVRFPRALLDQDWRRVASEISRLIAGLKPRAG